MASSFNMARFKRMPSFRREESYVMVAAIDLGTTYSGYGYSFKSSPNEVFENKNWGDELGTTSHKAPTSVLVDDKAQFVAFGYQAEHKYSEMCLTYEGEGYDLYRHFKMKLYHEKDLNRKTLLKSTRGNICKAMKIFTMALKYLKNHLLEAVQKQVDSKPTASLIKWVITIPAIWNDKAKQFMREAAFEAGLVKRRDSKQLLFALESEAASVLCRNLEVHHFREHSSGVNVRFEPGIKYMIIDAGGGTIDIVAHQVLAGGHMKEIACGSGGDWGGSQVDKNFISFVTSILGEDFIKAFQTKYPSDWLDFMTEFELRKKATNLGSGKGIRMQLSWSMAEAYTKITGVKIQNTIMANSHKGISFKAGNIIFSEDIVEGFFNPVLDNIISHIQMQLEESPQLIKLDYFLLVGGFSESDILYQRLQNALSSTAPIISQHFAGLAIVKGAVMFGHNPKTVTERIARKTYGQSVSKPFDYEKHDMSKLFIHQEKKIEYSDDVFQPLIRKGDVLKIDDVKTFHLQPCYRTQTSVKTEIFTSDKVDMIHTDEPGIEQIGSLSINMPLSKSKRSIETKVSFGLTETEVEFTDTSIKDGDTTKCAIDFLTDQIQHKQNDFDPCSTYTNWS